MRKIAFVSTMSGGAWGGSEELWAQAAARLAQSGLAVGANVITNAQYPKRLKDLEADGVTVVRRLNEDGPAPTLALKIKRRLLPENAKNWLDSFKPDFTVISQGTHFEGYPWMQACVDRRLPFATIAQAAHEGFWPSLAKAREISAAYEQAQAAFFVSQGNLELTRRQLATPLANAQVIFNPFGVPYDAAPPWQPPEGGLYKLACVGRLEPGSKGQDVLFAVMRQDKWRARPLAVTLFGHGPNEDSLKALRALYGLTNVDFGGFVDGVEAIWRTHHALALPSRYEGLPLSVVEAMLCGRLCIVTDVAGNRELVDDDVSGFIAAAPSVRALDEAMERAWLRRAEWEAIGQAARRRAHAVIPADPVGVFIGKLMALIPAERERPTL